MKLLQDFFRKGHFEDSRTLGWWVGGLLLLVLTFAAYWPAVGAGFIWDDEDILTANPLVTGPGGMKDIWRGKDFYDFWPLTLTSFWVEWRLWGMNAMGYHVTNILLHVGAAVLFWRVMARLRIPGAWLAAAVFALHPINVQSVAWITERKNTLSLFFAATALWWYLRFDSGEGRKWLSLSFAAFVLALLSKTSVVMLPFLLLVCAWWQGGKIQKRDAFACAPFFAAGLVLGLVTIWFQYHRSISTDIVNESNFAQRLAGAGLGAWYYAAHIFWPVHLVFVYPRWQIVAGDWNSYVPGVVLLTLWWLCWYARKSWGRPGFFALSWFLIMLFPVMGFFNIYFQKYSFIADHWVYPAMIGLAALAVGSVTKWLERPPAKIEPKPARKKLERSASEKSSGPVLHPSWAVIAGALVVTLASLTWAQCSTYRDEETLWRATLKRNPSCWLAWHNLAGIIVTATRPDPAAGGLSPGQRAQLAEALFDEQRAVGLNPNHAAANYGAGMILSMLGQVEDAIPYHRRAIEIQPDNLAALDALAWILAMHENPKVRDPAEAVRLARRAAEISGEGDPKVLETLAMTLAVTKDFAGAARAIDKAQKLATAAGQKQYAAQLESQFQGYWRQIRSPER